MGECALWFWRYYAVDYEICPDEQDAASRAVYLEDFSGGVPIGVQFSDGRTLTMHDWPAYREAYEEYEAREKLRREQDALVPSSPTRVITDPFEGKPITVDMDAPAWLGRPD